LWAQGLTGPQISERLGLTVSYITGSIVWKARKAGDPRAVVRTFHSAIDARIKSDQQ
jgi:hypothetical protein